MSTKTNTSTTDTSVNPIQVASDIIKATGDNLRELGVDYLLVVGNGEGFSRCVGVEDGYAMIGFVEQVKAEILGTQGITGLSLADLVNGFAK